MFGCFASFRDITLRIWLQGGTSSTFRQGPSHSSDPTKRDGSSALDGRAVSPAGPAESSRRRGHLIPTTIESGPTSASTRVSRKPAFFIHPLQSAPE